jgi:hypothetical protein
MNNNGYSSFYFITFINLYQRLKVFPLFIVLFIKEKKEKEKKG